MDGVRTALAFACAFAGMAVGISTRLAHPDLSETRLMLELWPRYCAVVALCIVSVWLFRGKDAPVTPKKRVFILRERRFDLYWMPKRITYVKARGFSRGNWFVGIARFPQWADGKDVRE